MLRGRAKGWEQTRRPGRHLEKQTRILLKLRAVGTMFELLGGGEEESTGGSLVTAGSRVHKRKIMRGV